MSFFGSIVDKIVHYAGAALSSPAVAATPAATPGAAPEASSSAATPGTATAGTTAAGTAQDGNAPALQSVDVGAVLGGLAQQKGGGLNWQSSIVDLLKLLDLDSSLAARKTLAQELDVHVGADGSAEQNIALHKAVVAKLAENGGKIPAELQH